MTNLSFALGRTNVSQKGVYLGFIWSGCGSAGLKFKMHMSVVPVNFTFSATHYLLDLSELSRNEPKESATALRPSKLHWGPWRWLVPSLSLP
jgi:hypothetical protein